MTNARPFPIRADKQARIEVHVAGFCFRTFGRKLQLLVGKRTANRELFPGLWECGGGQIRSGENFTEALSRQYFEEFGVEVHIGPPFSVYEILRSRKPKIPGLKFLCFSKDNGKENIILSKRELSDYRWVTDIEGRSLSMIPGVQADVRRAFAHARQMVPLPTARSRAKRIGFDRT